MIYRRRIDATQTHPVMAKVRFDLHSGDVIENNEWAPVQGRQLVVNQPSEAVLDVSLLPSGNGWGRCGRGSWWISNMRTAPMPSRSAIPSR